MKRGRGSRPRDKPLQVVTTAKTAKKKGKRVVCKGKEVAEKAVEEQKPAALEVEVQVLGPRRELEEWGGLWSEVDEEMTWGSNWCPYWEMEGMVMGMGVGVREAYDAAFLYSDDVLWDYDIWNWEAIGYGKCNAPNP